MFSPSPDKKNVSTTPTKTLKQLCRDRQLSTAGIVERAELEQLVLSSVAHWGAIPAAAEPEPDAAVEPEPEPVAEEDPAAADPAGADAEERRLDPADGNAYTRQEFEDAYGGTTEWDAAEKAP